LPSEPELSKSRFFLVEDGTTVVTGESAGRFSSSESLPTGIIDQKYELLGLLGEGGMGAVFRAHHLLLDKDVALKTFRSTNLSEAERLRFQREAQAIAKLSHVNVVQVFDFGLGEDGVPYYTMEYLGGESLADRIKKNGRLSIAQALEIFIPVCRGLSLAHSKGIIHRDLKPANLFIEKTTTRKGTVETVKIVDFGIASLTSQSPDGQRLTSHGTVFGSPLYMSPEQSMGNAIDGRADIYSLGCSLFETLTGSPPFRGGNALETITLHHTCTAPTLSEACEGTDFPKALEQTIATMLAKAPEDRQQTFDEVAAYLLQVSSSQNTVGQNVNRTIRKVTADFNLESFNQGAQKVGAVLSTGATTPLRLGSAMAILLIVLGGIFYFSTYKQSTVLPGHDSASHNANSDNPVNHDTAKVAIEAEKTADAVEAPTTDAAETPPLVVQRKELTLRGKTFIEFTFPKDLPLGSLASPPSTAIADDLVGSMLWSKDTCPVFKPSKEFIANPKNFEVFHPYDLFGLDLTVGFPGDKNSALMKQISRLKGLRQLDLSGGSLFFDTDVSELAKLPELNSLDVSRTGITGPELAKMPRFNKLNCLTYNQCLKGHELLIALQGNTSLKRLTMQEDSLTAADFKLMANIPNLEHLLLNDSGVKISDLESFLPLKRLIELNARDCVLTPQAYRSLKLLRQNGIENVRFDGRKLSKAEFAIVKSIFPNSSLTRNKNQDVEEVTDKEWRDLPGEAHF
jgi:serine/threonine protein kinase